MDAVTPHIDLDRCDEIPFAALEQFLSRFTPERPRGRRGDASRRLAVGFSTAVSAALHGAAAALALLAWSNNEQGVLQQPTEAISLEIARTEVLEQAQPQELDPAAGAPSSVAQKAGAEEDLAAATLSDVKPTESVPMDTATEVAPAPTETVISGAAEVEEAPPPPAETAREEDKPAPPREAKAKPEPKPEKRPPEKIPDKTQAKASTKGGAPSRSNAASKSSAGRASASAGDIAAYAAQVRAQVAANRPGGRGGHGTAVIAFGVSPSGGLAYARLSRSSGVPALDQAALSAVRGAAPFPRPPTGARSLSFTFPFYFR